MDKLAETYLTLAIEAEIAGDMAEVDRLLDSAVIAESKVKTYRRSIIRAMPRVNIHMNGSPAAPVPPNPAWR